jgi:hypothetical protein
MVERKSMISYRSKIKIQRFLNKKKKDLNLAKTHLEQQVLNSGFTNHKWWMKRCWSSIENFSQMYKYLYTSKIRIQRGFAKKKARFEVCGNVCSGKQFFNGEQKISSSDTIAASNLKKNVHAVTRNLSK